jgi:UDP-N-acetylglucosamine enolpyruvyl transferase
MNKIITAALEMAGGTEIGKQVTDLKDNVMDTVGLKAETKEALQEANLDQVTTTYEALATKVGITDQKDIITDFVSKGKNKDKFVELHTKIKSLAQQ